METYKTGTVNTIINENGVDLGSINVNLYTMDNKTSVIDIHVKKKNIINENQEYISVNFNQTKFEPVLHVFAQDGSIFTNEPLEIVKAEEGFVRYIIPEYITKHVGQMQCKLFLENPENNDSTHVANFYFTVNDSGITKSVGKEIRVELLDDIVEKVMKDNVDIFKGPKGDTGEQGPAGQDGKDGKNGINGIDGIMVIQVLKDHQEEMAKMVLTDKMVQMESHLTLQVLQMNKKQKSHLNYLILATGNSTDLLKTMEVENGLGLCHNR